MVRKDASVAVIPSVARPTAGAWYEGSDLSGLAEAAGLIQALLPGAAAARVKADLFDVKRPSLRSRERLLREINTTEVIRTSMLAFLLATMRALERGAVVSEVTFYNWGHLRDANLVWIAIKAVAK